MKRPIYLLKIPTNVPSSVSDFQQVHGNLLQHLPSKSQRIHGEQAVLYDLSNLEVKDPQPFFAVCCYQQVAQFDVFGMLLDLSTIESV